MRRFHTRHLGAPNAPRRSLLLMSPPFLSTFLLAPPLQTTAAEEQVPVPTDAAELDAIRTTVFRSSGVRPALPTRAYAEQLADNYPKAMAQIASYLDRSRYRELSNELVLPPFDVLRQACFYLPWALLEEDAVTEGIATQIKYNTLLDSIKAFDANLLAAARLQVDDEVVEESFAMLQRNYVAFFNTIPARYRVGLGLAVGSGSRT